MPTLPPATGSTRITDAKNCRDTEIPLGGYVKTCEYCGSEVPDDTVSCPNCAAHFEYFPPPPPPPSWPQDASREPADPNPFKSRLDRSFWSIGRLVAVLFVVYLALMFIGLLGSVSRWLLLAGILLVAAVLILRKALKS